MPTDKRSHVQFQKEYFDRNSEFFRQPIPQEIEERTRRIVESANVGETSRVLDVGTGMGVLVKHFLACGVKPENIVGIDLSEKMLGEARSRYPGVTFRQGDFVDYNDGANAFDAVFFNACFGNIFDRERALQVARDLSKPGASVVISHPLGNKFVRELQEREPDLVLTEMPPHAEVENWCATLGLELAMHIDEPDFYLTILQKARQT